MKKVEELVQRTQRSILEGMEGALQRQVSPLIENARRTVVDAAAEVLNKNADVFVERLKTTLLKTAEEIRERQTQPMLDSFKQTALGILEEIGKKHAATMLVQVKDALSEALGQQLNPLADRTRKGMNDGSDFVREQVDHLADRLRLAVTEPLRDQVPDYARRAGSQLINYALSGTLFCAAAIFLVLGIVQGLQAAGLPSFLTYILGGIAALVTGLVFLRMYKQAPAPPG
ncbi:MAG: phage holin family protein [Planctomycetes bacterium]|nr:phage holin family protein [Planctomycetota bacterium]